MPPNGPPPPPPAPGQRGGQRPPQPPPGIQIPRPPPPGGMPMMQQLPIRQSIRIQDITPPMIMDEKACLKKLTTYAAYTIRKCPPRNPKKERRGTWARVDVIEEHWPQEDILKQIKKLGERGRSVADRTKVLAPNMQTQITTLVDNLASTERDRAFEWSLVQLDTVQKPVSLKGGKKSGLYETVTMTAFAKRSPRKDLNPIILFENIERSKAERMQPPPQPQGPPNNGAPQGFTQIIDLNKEGGNRMKGEKGRSKSREKKYPNHDDSSTGDSSSSDSDSGSGSSHTGSGSLPTSISSGSRGHRRNSSHDNKAYRSHSRHREPPRYYLDPPRAHSPELHFHDADAYGGVPRPYVPDVPRLVPAAPAFDPVAAAYRAGIDDTKAERFGTADRIVERPVERIIERVIEPRPVPVISYGRMEPRYAEPRFDDRYVDDHLRLEEDFLRRRDAEEYIEGRLDGRAEGRRRYNFDRRPSDIFYEGRRPSDFDRRPFDPLYEDRRPSDFDRRPSETLYERRISEPIIFADRHPLQDRHPFAPAPLPRRYPPNSSISGW
jgi:hypothetical protein